MAGVGGGGAPGGVRECYIRLCVFPSVALFPLSLVHSPTLPLGTNELSLVHLSTKATACCTGKLDLIRL